MPMAGRKLEELPKNVQKLPEKLREMWVKIWDSTKLQCDKQKGTDCEGRAFRVANAVTKRAASKAGAKMLALFEDEPDISVAALKALLGDVGYEEDAVDAWLAAADELSVELEDVEPAVKIGMRNRGTDQTMIQTIHDTSAKLGADCPGMKMADGWVGEAEQALQLKALSLNVKLDDIRTNWRKQYMRRPLNEDEYYHIIDVEDDPEERVIVAGNGGYWAYPYKQTGRHTYEFENPYEVDKAGWERVEETEGAKFRFVEGQDILVHYGSEVKAEIDEENEDIGLVSGYLVLFTSEDDPDVSIKRDFFTPETDYDVDFTDEVKSTVYFSHGLDRTMGRRKLGASKATLGIDEVGVWIKHQLDLRNRWEQAVFKMVENNKLGWSSGTLPHLVTRELVAGKAHKILTWPLGSDASLTPTPAEPRNMAYAMSLKSLFAQFAKTAQVFDGSEDASADLEPGGSSDADEALDLRLRVAGILAEVGEKLATLE